MLAQDKKALMRLLELTLFISSAASIPYALYLVFLDVPNERIMGAVQRIFYFHVGSAIACYLACAVLFTAALAYLSTRNQNFDSLLQASGEVAFVFASIVLSSGMIWGHAAWNIWFRWEPRLVSFLLLWLILAGFLLLREFGDPLRKAEHSAVLGIASALMIPIIIFSIKMLPKIAQLHPVVVENQGLKDPRYTFALFISTIALSSLCLLLIAIRSRIARLSLRSCN